MTDELKVGVRADLGTSEADMRRFGESFEGAGDRAQIAERKMQGFADEVNRLSRRATGGAIGLDPKDFKGATRQLDHNYQEFRRRVQFQRTDLGRALRATGQSKLPLWEIDFGRMTADAKRADQWKKQLLSEVSTGVPGVGGIAWDQWNKGGGGGPSPAGGGAPPTWGRYLSSLARNVGSAAMPGAIGATVRGGASGLAQAEEIQAARAAAGAGGGLMGGTLGRVGGAVAGAGAAGLAYGAYKLVSGASEGIDRGREEAIAVDTLKRSVGDIGVDFVRLRETLRSVADDYKTTFAESQRVGATFARSAMLSNAGAESLSREVAQAQGFSRSFGSSPDHAASFFGGMRALKVTIDESGTRRLSFGVAEALARSHMTSRTDEMLASLEQMAVASTSKTFSAANTPEMLKMMTSMLSGGTPGMTPDRAAGMLSHLDRRFSAAEKMDEPSWVFAAHAVSQGQNDIYGTQRLLQGGIWATPRSVGLDDWKGDKDKSNLSAIMESFKDERQSFGKSPREQFSALGTILQMSQQEAERMFQWQQAGGAASLQGRLKRVGVEDTVNPTGLSRLAQIDMAPDAKSLAAIEKDLRDKGVKFNESELSGAKAGGLESYKDLLTRLAAPAGQTDTTAKDARDALTSMDRVMQRIGSELIPATAAIRDVLVSALKHFVPEPLLKQIKDQQDRERLGQVAREAEAAGKDPEQAQRDDIAGRARETRNDAALGMITKGPIMGTVNVLEQMKEMRRLEGVSGEISKPAKGKPIGMTDVVAEAKRMLGTSYENSDADRAPAMPDIRTMDKTTVSAQRLPPDVRDMDKTTVLGQMPRNVGNADVARMLGVKIPDAVEDGIRANAKSPMTAELARTVLAIENRGFGAPRNATSPVGASGYWQIMPKTAPDLGLSLADRDDPDKATKGAVGYLDKLSKRYGGDPRLAAVAYHTGMGNVDKWNVGPEGRKYGDMAADGLGLDRIDWGRMDAQTRDGRSTGQTFGPSKIVVMVQGTLEQRDASGRVVGPPIALTQAGPPQLSGAGLGDN